MAEQKPCTVTCMTIHVTHSNEITFYLPKNTDNTACAALLADEGINVAGEFALDNLR